MREGTITLADGRVLAYGDHGEPGGTPVIYHHGLPGGKTLALDESALRAVGARMITPERPGIGSSTRAPGRTLEDWPSDVAELADALGLERFALFGLSGGGSHALAVAQALPERVVAVGLASALGPILDHPDFDDESDHSLIAFLPVARQDPGAAEELLREVLAPLGDRCRANPEAFFEEWLEPLPEEARTMFLGDRDRWLAAVEATHRDPDGYADDIVAGLRWTFDPGDIEAPVRAWHGTADNLAPLALMRLVVDEARGELVEVEGGGHFLGPRHHEDWLRWLMVLRE